MGYPIILGGDHAAFEAQWAKSGRPDHERPDWPLPSFDAQDWAKAFNATAVKLGYSTMDEAWLVGWFANALMRGYDERAAKSRPEDEMAARIDRLEEAVQELNPGWRP